MVYFSTEITDLLIGSIFCLLNIFDLSIKCTTAKMCNIISEYILNVTYQILFFSIDYFYYKEHLFIVQELLLETLSSSMEKIFRGNPDSLKKLAIEILQCLDLLSANNIIHCDLNPDNILIVKKSKEDEAHYKVIDFNSAITNKDTGLHSYPMLAYTAPDIIESNFSSKIDIWSLGCIIVECCIGRPLFNPLSEQELMFLIQETIQPFPQKVVENPVMQKPQRLDQLINQEDRDFCDFIRKMLEVDPSTRLSAKEALMHPWLN